MLWKVNWKSDRQAGTSKMVNFSCTYHRPLIELFQTNMVEVENCFISALCLLIYLWTSSIQSHSTLLQFLFLEKCSHIDFNVLWFEYRFRFPVGSHICDSKLMRRILAITSLNQCAAKSKFVEFFMVAQDDLWYIFKSQNLLLWNGWWKGLFNMKSHWLVNIMNNETYFKDFESQFLTLSFISAWTHIILPTLLHYHMS